MTIDLEAIEQRAAASDPQDCEFCHEYSAGPAEADRAALLAELQAARRDAEALREDEE